MSAIITVLIVCLVIAAFAYVCIWAIETMLATFGAPAPLATVARVIVVLIALLLIAQRLLPLAGVNF